PVVAGISRAPQPKECIGRSVGELSLHRDIEDAVVCGGAVELRLRDGEGAVVLRRVGISEEVGGKSNAPVGGFEQFGVDVGRTRSTGDSAVDGGCRGGGIKEQAADIAR